MTSAMQRSCKRLRIVGNRGSITVLRDRREESVATITLLLQRVREGEQTARDSLFELAYNNLKGLARSRLRSDGRGGQLDTTALVHEAYLRFVNSGDLRADDRRAFFAYASSVMIEANLRLVVSVARAYVGRGVSLMPFAHCYGQGRSLSLHPRITSL